MCIEITCSLSVSCEKLLLSLTTPLCQGLCPTMPSLSLVTYDGSWAKATCIKAICTTMSQGKGQVLLFPAPLRGQNMGQPHAGHDKRARQGRSFVISWDHNPSPLTGQSATEETFFQRHDCSVLLNKASNTSQEQGHIAGKLHQSREPSVPADLSVHTQSGRNKGMRKFKKMSFF